MTPSCHPIWQTVISGQKLIDYDMLRKVDVVYPSRIDSQIGPAGTLRRIINYRPYFLERGYDITVFSLSGIHTDSVDVAPRGSSSSRQSRFRFILKRLKALIPHSFVLSLLYVSRNFKRTAGLVDKYLQCKRNPDIVVFHGYDECWRYLRKRTNTSAKTVMFLHSDGVPYKMVLIYYPKLKGTFAERKLMSIHRECISSVDKCVFIAKIGLDNFLLQNQGYPVDKCFLLINGIDDLSESQNAEIKRIRKARTADRVCRLVCTGTLLHRKGQDVIIEAMSRLSRESLSGIHLTLIGDGPLRGELENMIARYGLGEAVTLLGAVPNPEVFRHLAGADIFVLMSMNEGLPISIIEAMRCGLPVITTDNSGMPEIVRDGFNGLVLPTGDADSLARVLSDPGKYDWARFGLNSRAFFIGHLTFERMRREYCDMLDTLNS